VPLYPLTPGLYIVAALGIVLHAAVARPAEAALGMLTVALGVPLYWLQQRNRRMANGVDE
jgi:hypothetical protein